MKKHSIETEAGEEQLICSEQMKHALDLKNCRLTDELNFHYSEFSEVAADFHLIQNNAIEASKPPLNVVLGSLHYQLNAFQNIRNVVYSSFLYREHRCGGVQIYRLFVHANEQRKQHVTNQRGT